MQIEESLERCIGIILKPSPCDFIGHWMLHVLGKCNFEKALHVCCVQLVLFIVKLDLLQLQTFSFSISEVCCEEIKQVSRVQNVFFNICKAVAAWEVNVLWVLHKTGWNDGSNELTVVWLELFVDSIKYNLIYIYYLFNNKFMLKCICIYYI